MQPWISPTLPNRQGSLSASAEQSSESVLNSGFGSEPIPVETKSAGRAELPEVIAFPFNVSIFPVKFSC